PPARSRRSSPGLPPPPPPPSSGPPPRPSRPSGPPTPTGPPPTASWAAPDSPRPGWESAQLVFHDLAGGVERELIEELDVPGHLVAGHPVPAPGDELLGGHEAAADHERLSHLPEPVVGHADHGDLGHPRMLQQEALDLRGVGVEPAHDEHVLLAADDPQASAAGKAAEIPGVQPAVGIDGLGGRRRVVEVALHHALAAHQHLAVVG